MSATCPYKLLGVSYQATEQEIKRAYAAAFKKIRAGVDKDVTFENFDAIRNAYLLLSNAEQRHIYDQERQATAESPALTDSIQEYVVRFDGSAKVYSRIWITNLLLSILTLGIYSAWAKVRREQYFHRHLRLDGVAFDYHARPQAILRGRIVFFTILAAYSLTQFISPTVQRVVGLAMLFLFPWMMVRSLQFRAANTSYRGLRFKFGGLYWEAFRVYVGYSLLIFLTLGLALPLAMWRQKKFVIGHLAYGDNTFGFHATRAAFYRALWLPTLILFVMLAGPIVALILFGQSLLFVVIGLMVSKVLVPFLIIGAVFLNLVVIPYARMIALNVAWTHTRINDTQMVCRQRFISYSTTHISNWLLMILSLGLFWPWAVIRMIGYRARHFSIKTNDSLGDFVAGRNVKASALAGEAAASLDMEIGL